METKGKILFLAPTKPLVNQHEKFLKTHLTINSDNIIVFTGNVPPEKRGELWSKGKIVVSTPQVVENDIISDRIDLSDVSLIIFDEAHRAVGDYSYVYIAERYTRTNRSNRLVLSITASPGSEANRILEVCKNLGIDNVEIRTQHDKDVRPYVQDLRIEWKLIPLPEDFKKIIFPLNQVLQDKLKVLKKLGAIESASVSKITRKRLLEAQKMLQGIMHSRSKPSKALFEGISAQSAAMKTYHAIELVQTQGTGPLRKYFKRLQLEASSKGGSKASRCIVRDQRIIDAILNAKYLGIEHPKIKHVIDIVQKQVSYNKNSCIIVFTQYRDTARQLVTELENIEGIRPIRFVGQSKKVEDKGLTQKDQAAILEKFRVGEYNTLIATSVAEEGLDIPSTNLVIFYEPIPSEIRTIQRKGRTARRTAGRVIILIAKNTQDEAYYWSSKRKEKQMINELNLLKSKLYNQNKPSHNLLSNISPFNNAQKTLTEFFDTTEDNKINIVVDNREYRSRVVRELTRKNNIHILPRQLDIGDYVLSSRLGVERKTDKDFLFSLLDGKLFRQMMQLRSAYSRPILILEGEGLFTTRNINYNAIVGSLASVIVDFGIPIITTKDALETADLLFGMAKREQRKNKKEIIVRGNKRLMPLREKQQFIVEGLPNVSAVLAKRLLTHFKSIKNIANATEDELCEVSGVGKNIASEILKIINARYLEE
jgi:Fanconi anemia group M protein